MMRKVLATVQMNGIVVIGEGEKDVSACTSITVLPRRNAPFLAVRARIVAAMPKTTSLLVTAAMGLKALQSGIKVHADEDDLRWLQLGLIELDVVALVCCSSVESCFAGSSYAVLWRRDWHRR